MGSASSEYMRISWETVGRCISRVREYLGELAAFSPELGETYNNIIDQWVYTYSEMTVNRYSLASQGFGVTDGSTGLACYTQIVTDDALTIPEAAIPDDVDWSTVCIVVLGYALQDDGNMKNEAYGRCLTAYAILEATGEQAMIAITGGGTAKNNAWATEGGQVKAFQISLGVPEVRSLRKRKRRIRLGMR